MPKKTTEASTRTRSNKAKGRIGQQEVAQMIRDYVAHINPLLEWCHEDRDLYWKESVKSTSMGMSGEDIQLSPEVRKYFNFQVEVKRSAKSTLDNWMEQAKSHGSREPIVFSRKDGVGKKWIVSLDAECFFNMLGKEHR